ncbi:hypothetical protein BpHYR1_006737 [Brachionus plicatilis]|uniref:Uncharacterized protein n=1 Tax=Brachionus plicatilis TaxID=10195 RepID=A0A3M7RXF2_BRAPC|nr:hypothetical protein BpHYR1_006737 [Brachionus plicatilis]
MLQQVSLRRRPTRRLPVLALYRENYRKKRTLLEKETIPLKSNSNLLDIINIFTPIIIFFFKNGFIRISIH